MHDAINALFGLVTIATLIGGPIGLILWSRASFLRSLDQRALGSLGRLTATLFDEQPISHVDATGGSRVEGKRGGETFAVRVAFTREANAQYMRRGYKTRIAAATSVITGLKGAAPKLALRPKGEAPSLETDFERAFHVEADPELLDDATKALIMDLLSRGPRITAIRTDAEGLHVEWRSAAGLSAELMPELGREQLASRVKDETDAIALVMDFEKKLRARILEVVERRAEGPRVRVGAYRDETADPLEEPESEPQAVGKQR